MSRGGSVIQDGRRLDSRWAVAMDGVTIVELHPQAARMKDAPAVGYVMARTNFEQEAESRDGNTPTVACKERAALIVRAVNVLEDARAMLRELAAIIEDELGTKDYEPLQRTGEILARMDGKP